MKSLKIYQRPDLRNPHLVVGFGGWPNAAELSTETVSYLTSKLKATKFAEIDPQDFYEFSSSRPIAVVEDGFVREVDFPSNEFFFWKGEKSIHDLILLLGLEPNLRWGEYVDAVLQLAEEFGVKRVYVLGGFYDSIPHTRESKVSASVTSLELKEEMERYDVEFTDYQGPSSIHTTLMVACRERNIEAISLWGRAPHYVPMFNPKICYGILTRLTKMLQIDVDLEDVKMAGERLNEQVDEALAQDPRFRAYVERLEEAYEAMARYEPLEGDEIVKGIEEFLKGERGKEGQS